MPYKRILAVVVGLNPFEVREVLQVHDWRCRRANGGLNPFEVREVLQDLYSSMGKLPVVSIPLKSGRCCKRPRRVGAN